MTAPRGARGAALGVLLTAIVGIGALSIDMLLPSLPTMVGDFRSDAATVQLTVTLFLIGFAVAQLVFGPLSDRFGRRHALLGGLCLYGAGALGCALAPSAPVLVLARVVQGLGAGSGPAVGRAIVRDVYAPEHGARILALMAMAQALTPILAPILGGYLQIWVGWRSVFVVQVGFAALFLAAAARMLHETVAAHDVHALRPRTLFRNARALLADPAYVGFTLVVALVFSGQFAFISGSSFVLIGLLKLSPDVYGYCFGIVAFGLMTGSFLTARLTLQHGTRRLVSAGATLSAASGCVMAALPLLGSVTVPGVVAPMYLYAVGAGLVMPSGMAGAIGPFPKVAGLASAVLGFLQMSGSAIYSIAVSRLYDGTARPMTLAIAVSGLACLGCRAVLLRTPARAPRSPSA